MLLRKWLPLRSFGFPERSRRTRPRKLKTCLELASVVDLLEDRTLLSAVDDSYSTLTNTPLAAGITNGGFDTGNLRGWTTFTTASGTLGQVGFPDVVKFDTDGDGVLSEALQVLAGNGGGGIVQNVNVVGGDVTVEASVAASSIAAHAEAGNFELLFDGVVVDSHNFGSIVADSTERASLSADLTSVSAGAHEVRLRITRSGTSDYAVTPFGWVDDVHLYVAQGSVLENDTGTGLTAILVEGPANGAVSLNPDGSFYYTPDDAFVGVDQFVYESSDSGVELFTVDVSSDRLLKLDSVTGTATDVGPVGHDMVNVDLAQIDGTLYALNVDGTTFEIMTLNTTTGAASNINSLSVSPAVQVAKGITAVGSQLYVNYNNSNLSTNRVGELDPATGIITNAINYASGSLGGFNHDFESLATDFNGNMIGTDSRDSAFVSFKLGISPPSIAQVGAAYPPAPRGVVDSTFIGQDYYILNTPSQVLNRLEPEQTGYNTIVGNVNLGAASTNYRGLAYIPRTATVSINVSGTAPGISITESNGSSVVSETGTTDTFHVVLTAQPASDVVLDLASDDTDEVTVSPSRLTFTNSDWNTPQEVTVTGVLDALVDGDQVTAVTLTVNDALSDNAYDPLPDETVPVTTTDLGDIVVNPDSYTVSRNQQLLAGVRNGDFETDDLNGWATFTETGGTLGGTGFPDVVKYDTNGDGVLTEALQLMPGNGGGGIFQSVDTISGSITISADIAVDSLVTNSEGGRFDLLLDNVLIDSHDFGSVTANTPERATLSSTRTVSAGAHELKIRVVRNGAASYGSTPIAFIDNVQLYGNSEGVLGNDAAPVDLNARLVTGTQNGSLSFNQDGSFQYVPDTDFTGTDQFVYEATQVDQGLVFFSVDAVNDKLLKIDSVSGAFELVGAIRHDMHTVDLTEHNGALYALNVDVSSSDSSEHLYEIVTIDPTTGIKTGVLPIAASLNAAKGIASLDGEIYIIYLPTGANGTNAQRLARVNLATGAITQLADYRSVSGGFNHNLHAISTDANGDIIATRGESGTGTSYRLAFDPDPDAITSLGDVGPQVGVNDTTTAGSNFYILNPGLGVIHRIDPINPGYGSILENINLGDIAPNLQGLAFGESLTSNNATVTINVTSTAPDVLITESAGATHVSESGTTDSFDVVLAVQPATDVVVDISSNDTNEVTVNESRLTFTNSNWNQPQTVTAVGENDGIVDGDQLTRVDVVVNDGLSDAAYDAVPDHHVSVTTTDLNSINVVDDNFSTEINQPLNRGVINGDFESDDLTGWSTFTLASGTLGGPGFPDVVRFDTDGDTIVNQGLQVLAGGGGGGVFQTVNTITDSVTVSAAVAVNPIAANSEGGIFELLFDGVVIDSHDFGSVQQAVPERAQLLATVNSVSVGPHEVRIRIRRTAASEYGTSPIGFVDDVYVFGNNGGVLGNDVSLSELEALIVAGPDHGTLDLNPDGSFDYVPDTGYTGTDQFTYEGVERGQGLTLYSVDAVNDKLVRFDSENGTFDLVGAIGHEMHVVDLTFHNGLFYALNVDTTPTDDSLDIYEIVVIDPVTGRHTEVIPIAASLHAAKGITSVGDDIYIIYLPSSATGTNAKRLARVDLDTGGITQVASYGSFNYNFFAISTDADGRIIGTENRSAASISSHLEFDPANLSILGTAYASTAGVNDTVTAGSSFYILNTNQGALNRIDPIQGGYSNIVEDIDLGPLGSSLSGLAFINSNEHNTATVTINVAGTAPGFTVTQADGATSVSETGTSDQIEVALTKQPATDVVIDLTGVDATEFSADQTQLTFTNSNWNSPQQIVLTGLNDTVLDGDQITKLTLIVNAGLSDDAFDSLPPQMVQVTTTDLNDLDVVSDTYNITENTTLSAGVINGGFELGDLTGWTTFTETGGTLGGIGFPDVVKFDTDADGVATEAIQLLPGDGGGGIYQSVSTEAGDVSLSVSTAVVPLVSQAEGGLVELLFDGAVIDSHNFGSVAANTTEYAVLSGTVSGVSLGNHEIRLRAVRNAASSYGTSPVIFMDDVEVHGNSGGILANDTDPDGDALSAILMAYPENGVVELSADGSFHYTPDTDFSGTDSFEYRATDQGQGLILYSVDAVNDKLLRIDSALGTIDVVGAIQRDMHRVDLTFRDGLIYALNVDRTPSDASQHVYEIVTIDPITGVHTGVLPVAPGLLASAEGITTVGDDIYIVYLPNSASGTNAQRLARVNLDTGAITQLADYRSVSGGFNHSFHAISTDSNGEIIGTENRSSASISSFLGYEPASMRHLGTAYAGTAGVNDTERVGENFYILNSNQRVLNRIDPARTGYATILEDIDLGLIGGYLQGLTFAEPLERNTATVTINVSGTAASLVVEESGGATSVSETLTTDSIDVSLSKQPATDVVVSVQSHDTNEVTVDLPELSFTNSNWNVPQTVVVTGVNDSQLDGDKVTLVGFSVVDARSDDAFASAADEFVSVKTDLDQIGPLDDEYSVPRNYYLTAGVMNGGFELVDLAGWTTFTQPGGTLGDGFPKIVPFDTNGNGAQSASLQVLAGDGGGGIYQTVLTESGDIDLSASVAVHSGAAHSEGGEIELLFDGVVVDSHDFGAVAANVAERSLLSGTVSGVNAGPHELRIRFVRNGASQSGVSPFAYLDDVLVFGNASGVSANDSVLDTALGAVLVTPPAHGNLELRDDGSFDYTPNSDYIGADEFTYRVSHQGQGLTLYAVDAVNDKLVSIDSRLGSVQMIGPIQHDMHRVDLAYRNGILYALNVDRTHSDDQRDIYEIVTIDPTTGRHTDVLTLAPGAFNSAEGVTWVGNDLYIIYQPSSTTGTNAQRLARVDLSTGAITQVADYRSLSGGFNHGFHAIATDSNGDIFGTENRSSASITSQLEFDPGSIAHQGTAYAGTPGVNDSTYAGTDFLILNTNQGALNEIDPAVGYATIVRTVALGSLSQNLEGLAYARDFESELAVVSIDVLGPDVLATATDSETRVSEDGLQDTLEVVLVAPPDSDVVLSVTSADPNEVGVDSETLTFTPSNWNISQPIKVSAVPEFVVDGTQSVNVTISVIDGQSDPDFHGVADRVFSVTSEDNDVAGVTYVESGGINVVSESANTDSITIKLTGQPQTNVTFTVSSADEGEVTVAPSEIIFTPSEWDTFKTITLAGVPDSIIDKDQTTIITLSIDSGRTDAAFLAISDVDFSVTTTDLEILNADFGDAPTASQSGFAASYPVLFDDGGAAHVAIGPQLGTSRDTELEGVASANASGDDTANLADEDGVSFVVSSLNVSPTEPYTGTVLVDLQNPDVSSNRLDAWIDFNQDGDWADSGEQIFTNTDLGTAAGSKELSFTIPAGAKTGSTFSRYRLSTVGGYLYSGPAIDGEVEDHAVSFVDPAPTVSLRRADGEEIYTSTNPFVVLVEFSEGVNDFDLSDITSTSVTLSNLHAVSPRLYQVTVTPTVTSGDLTLLIPAGNALDSAGQQNAESNRLIIGDGTGPTVVVDIVEDLLTATNPATDVLFQFNETVVNFDATDLTVVNGEVSGFTQLSGSSYTATFTASAHTDGVGSVTVGRDYEDADGNAGLGDSDTVLLDTSIPAVSSITLKDATPTNNNSVRFTVTFDSDVAGIDLNDFVLATSSSASGTISSVSATAEKTVSVLVANVAGDGLLGLNFDADASGGVFDSVGNASVTDFVGETYVVDNTQPTGDIIDISPDPRFSHAGTVLIQFSEPVVGVDIFDFTLGGGVRSIRDATLVGSGDSYSIDLSDHTDVAGSYSLLLHSSGARIFDLAGNALTDNPWERWQYPGRFLVTESGEDTVVLESGTSDTFQVVLTSRPASDVVLSVTSADESEATVSQSRLTFTAENWDTAQTVTVTGEDDSFYDRDKRTEIAIAVIPEDSNDAFDTVAGQSIIVTTIDDDDVPPPRVSISQTGGSTRVSESGMTDIINVVLDARPESDVVLTVTSSDVGEVTVSPATLTFTSDNWNQDQAIVVTGVPDNDVADGDVDATVVIAVDVGQSDPVYADLPATSVTVTNRSHQTRSVFTLAGRGRVTDYIDVSTLTGNEELDLELRAPDGTILSPGGDGRISLAGFPAGSYEVWVNDSIEHYTLTPTVGLGQATGEPAAPALDLGGNGQFEFSGDGVMLLAFALGGDEAALAELLSPQDSRSGGQVLTLISQLADTLDLDGDGRFQFAYDGVILLAYSLGVNAETIAQFASPNATRSGAEIIARLDGLFASNGPGARAQTPDVSAEFFVPLTMTDYPKTQSDVSSNGVERPDESGNVSWDAIAFELQSGSPAELDHVRAVEADVSQADRSEVESEALDSIYSSFEELDLVFD